MRPSDETIDNARRYDIVKELNPRQFGMVFGAVLKGQEFDSVIDEIGQMTIEAEVLKDTTLTELEKWGDNVPDGTISEGADNEVKENG